MRYKYAIFFGLGIIAASVLIFCTKKPKKLGPHAEARLQAVKDFKLTCVGEASKCEKGEISVTNISKKKYSNLIIICTDKDDPNESERDPHHNWPFSLEPNETKCMQAADSCFRKKHKDKELGDYYTLIQLDSDNNPVWKLGNDCDPKNPKKE